MDIEKALLKEHSRKTSLKIADYVAKNTSELKVLVELFIRGPYRMTQRASWPLSMIGEEHREMIIPYLSRLIAFASTPGVHDAAKRNVMRILQFAGVPKRLRGKALDLAFTFFQDKKEPIAVRVFSMSVIEQLTRSEDELRRELQIMIEDEMPYAGPGFRSRGSKILKVMLREQKEKNRAI
jgi:hypothetical protein